MSPIPKRNKLLKKFGIRLKRLRKQKKLSGAELGREIGMHRQAIQRFEAGGANPSLVIVNKLCKALGVTIQEFFKGF